MPKRKSRLDREGTLVALTIALPLQEIQWFVVDEREWNSALVVERMSCSPAAVKADGIPGTASATLVRKIYEALARAAEASQLRGGQTSPWGPASGDNRHLRLAL